MLADCTILIDGDAAAPPLETPAGEAATAAATPLTRPSPAPGLLERSQNLAAALNAVDVVTPDRSEFLRELRLTLASLGPDDGHPGAALLLTGLAQTGTSTIAQKTLGCLSMPKPMSPWTVTHPAMTLSLDTQTSLQTLIWLMLTDLNPVFGLMTAASKIDPQRDGRRLRQLLKERQVEWLVVDHAEALVVDDPKKLAPIRGFLGRLRSDGINLILCGLEPVAQLVAATSETAADVVHCRTQVYDKANEADIDELARFVGAFLDCAALPAAVLAEDWFRQCLIEVTQGRRGLAKHLVKKAIMIAFNSGATSVTVKHFVRALKSGLNPELAKKLARAARAAKPSRSNVK